MTLLQLITNCINFTTQDEEELNPTNLETFRASTNYRAFIKNALPEINRAIQELVTLNKFPLQCYEFEYSKEIILTNDEYQSIYSIYKIEVETINGTLYSPVEYKKINNKIKLPSIYNGSKIYIKYYPRIKLLSEADKGSLQYQEEDEGIDDSLELNTIGVDDTICNVVIPYLVKSRIWQEIEPEMAQLDRNIGLQNASLLVNGAEEPYQTNVARSNEWGE